jgi:hypothetical protein
MNARITIFGTLAVLFSLTALASAEPALDRLNQILPKGTYSGKIPATDNPCEVSVYGTDTQYAVGITDKTDPSNAAGFDISGASVGGEKILTNDDSYDTSGNYVLTAVYSGISDGRQSISFQKNVDGTLSVWTDQGGLGSAICNVQR